jgi:hypothetical protein
VGYKPPTLSATEVMKTVDVMKQLSGTVEVVRAPDPTPDPKGGVEPPPPEVAVVVSSWTYTGFMQGPKIKKALVTIGPAGAGTQLMLAEGETHEGTKLLEIHPDHLLVEEGGSNQKRIELAARTLAWDNSPPKRPMPARPTAGMPGMPPGMAGMTQPGQPQPGFATPNAAAMAEAQRRMKAAIAPQPPRNELEKMAQEGGKLDQDKRDTLMKVMTEPGLSPEERGQMLREMGIPVDVSPDERAEYLKNLGISEQSDPKLYEMLKDGGGSK